MRQVREEQSDEAIRHDLAGQYINNVCHKFVSQMIQRIASPSGGCRRFAKSEGGSGRSVEGEGHCMQRP